MKTIIIPIIILLIVIILYISTKIVEKRMSGIQITPPDNLDSLELAYIYNGQVSNSDVLSLITYLIDKGYIKADVPLEVNDYKSTDFKLIKNKEYDGNNVIEGYIINKIFADSNIINYSDLQKNKNLFSFCTLAINSNNNVHDLIFNKLLKKIKKAINLLMLIGLFIYDFIYNPGNIWIYFIQIIALASISATISGSDTSISVNDGEYKLKRKSIVTVIIVILAFLMFSVINIFRENELYRSGQESITYMVGLLLFLLATFIKPYIKLRTNYGKNIYQKVLNFRDFLKLTPRESIEAEFNKNKDCYFDIFSYCFVLNMSNKCTSEYDKFFNNVWNMLYSEINSVENINDGHKAINSYVDCMEKHYEDFKNYQSTHNSSFLNNKYTVDDNMEKEINAILQSDGIVKYALKVIKDFIINN